MFRNRRLACLILGMWLGAAACIDMLVTQNFSTVDQFLAEPGSPQTSMNIQKAGSAVTRFVLRRNAGEENARIFEGWEWVQIFVAVGFFFLVLLGDRPSKLAMSLSFAMLLVLLVQRFFLTPAVSSLGREIADISSAELARSPLNSRFWTFHGLYSGSEILKLLLGLGVGARLMIRHSRDVDHFAKEYELAMGSSSTGSRRRHREGSSKNG